LADASAIAATAFFLAAGSAGASAFSSATTGERVGIGGVVREAIASFFETGAPTETGAVLGRESASFAMRLSSARSARTFARFSRQLEKLEENFSNSVAMSFVKMNIRPSA
jgi:hypothetical protein